MPTKRTSSGVTAEQFAMIITHVMALLVWDRPTGRKRSLKLSQAVKAFLLYARHNITEELLAELYCVHQSTISRTLATVGEVVATALAKYVPDLDYLRQYVAEHGEDILVADGTMVPCWNWSGTTGMYSGYRKTAGHNVQVVTDIARYPVYIAAFRATCLDDVLHQPTSSLMVGTRVPRQ